MQHAANLLLLLLILILLCNKSELKSLYHNYLITLEFFLFLNEIIEYFQTLVTIKNIIISPVNVYTVCIQFHCAEVKSVDR